MARSAPPVLLLLGDAWPVEAVATAALEPSGWAIDEGVVTIRTAVLWRMAMSNIILIVSCLSAATAAAWASRHSCCSAACLARHWAGDQPLDGRPAAA